MPANVFTSFLHFISSDLHLMCGKVRNNFATNKATIQLSNQICGRDFLNVWEDIWDLTDLEKYRKAH